MTPVWIVLQIIEIKFNLIKVFDLLILLGMYGRRRRVYIQAKPLTQRYIEFYVQYLTFY